MQAIRPTIWSLNFVFSFGVKPEATDDARNATGNIRIQTAGRSNFSVLTNDIGPGNHVSRRSIQPRCAVGKLQWLPTAHSATTRQLDTKDQTASTTRFPMTPAATLAQSVITIAGMIWFMNSAASACTTNNNTCGRLTNPFSTLAAFEAANGNATPVVNGDVTSPEAGDHLFIFSGSYTGALTLENNQRVIGAGATSSLQTLSGITPATDSDALPATGGANPTITSSGIAVAQNNRLHGLTVQNTTNTGISGNGFGTLTISENMIVE